MKAMAKAASRSQTTWGTRVGTPVEQPRKQAAKAPDARVRQWPWIYCLFASLAIAIGVFAPALNGRLLFDDVTLPFANPNAAQMPPAFWIGGVRPVLGATYWANFLISGIHPLGYHLTNVLLHGATALFVFFICDRILAISRAPGDRRWLALFGAALFLLHPLQTESVDYIAGRSELVSGFFYFASFLVFLRSFEKDTSLGLALRICLLAGLAVLGKESAISLPAIVILADFYFADEPIGKRLRRRVYLYSLFLIGVLAGGGLILARLAGDKSAGFSAGISPFEYALTQCRAILTYLRLFVIPIGQNGDWAMPFYHSFTDGLAAAYALALLALLALVVWLYKRERLVSFGLAAFLLMLAPTSSIVPIKDAIAERRMYLPILGLILALLGAASRIRLAPAFRWTLSAAILLSCAALSSYRSQVWTSDLSFWRDSARANPGNVRAHVGLGLAMMMRGDCAAAAQEYSIARGAASSAQGDTELSGNLAAAYQCNKEPAKALPLYRSIAAVKPAASVYNHIGYTEALLGDSEAAMDAFEYALKLDPNDATAYAYRGTARMALDNPGGAQADFRRALEIDPGNQIAADGMAKMAAP
jgi:protein O-mannosyl-transferase